MPPLSRSDRTLPTLDANLALDEALLLAAEAGEGGEWLRFWEWPHYTVVLGAGGSVALDVNEGACRAHGVHIHRRSSGGGTVLLGRGCLLFSLVLSFQRAKELADVTASYRWILGRIREALRPVAQVEPVGISDLAIGVSKVSGNAQQRKPGHVLHHGTLLYDFDLPRLGRYLNPPEREPAYRAGRAHGAFVTNLATTAEALKDRIAEAFGAVSAEIDGRVMARVPLLIEERYGREAWVRRR